MKEQLERDLIRYVIIATVLYAAYLFFSSLYPQSLPINALVSFGLCILFILLLQLNWRKKNIEWIAFAMHVAMLSVIVYFWSAFGGLAGSAPSALCTYTCFVVMASSGWARPAALVLLIALLFPLLLFPNLLGMDSVSEPEDININQFFIDYMAFGLLLMGFSLYYKRKFTFYRGKVEFTHRALNQSLNSLYEQNQELATQEEEIRAINDNLEALVEERSRQIEAKNQELAEYAFINAHLLRAPLCRVLGLINLMEIEPDTFSPEQIERVRQVAQAIDLKIREINHVVS